MADMNLNPGQEPDSTQNPVPENSTLNSFMEHQKQALAESRKALESLVPDAVRQHGSNAIREMLEGYRQLVNAALDEVQKTVEKVRPEKKDKVE